MFSKKTAGKKQKLALRFVFMLGIVIIGLFSLLTYISIQRVKDDTAANYEDDCVIMVRAYSYGISNWINKQLCDMNMYTAADILDSGSPEQIAAWLTSTGRKRPSTFDYVLFIDTTGKSWYDSGKTGNHSDRPYFTAIMKNGKKTIINDPMIAKSTGKTALLLVRAAYNSANELTGMFVGAAGIENLQETISKIKIGDGGTAFLLASDGTIIAHQNTDYQLNLNIATDTKKTSESMRSVAAQMIQGNNGSGFATGLDGKEKYIVYAPVAGTNWSLGVSIPVTQIYAVAANLRNVIIILAASIGAVLLLVSAVLIIIFLRPLQTVEKAITGIASGNADLTKRIEVKTKNEIGSVVMGFNGFVEKLQKIVTDIKNSKNSLASVDNSLQNGTKDATASITTIISDIDNVSGQINSQASSVDQTAGAVDQIAANIASLEHMIETQSESVGQASSAVEEMIGNIGSVNSSIEKMASSFSELEQNAQNGSQKQLDVNERIEQIVQQSEMLQNANTAIAAIASQTNLLAMNAAIEAAHAGEAGKGFSVVADEIRKLSETSSSQSKTIGDQLNNIRESIEAVVSASAESSSAFSSVTEKIHQTDELVRQIRGAMTEQQEGSKQILDSLHTMSDSSAEVKNASSEMSAGNKSILEEMERLKSATGTIKSSMESMTANANRIKNTGTLLTQISEKMNASIQQIGNEIDQFKV